jgi:uncharacterized membrane protein YgcG
MRLRRRKRAKINNIVRNSILKILVFSVIVGLNWAGLSAVGQTFSFFSDNEGSIENSFQATILDFSITNKHIEDFIGMEALSNIESASVVTKKTGSLNIQYEVYAEKISGDDNFCNALTMEVEHNGVEEYDGPPLSFSAATTTLLGTWELELDLPASATNVVHGAECNVDLVFKGWRDDAVTFEESGFTDEERIELRLTSRMIVLNEFLPNPEGEAYGYDFGDDDSTMPQGEWVELYNNSDLSYSLAGWYIWDDSGDNANKVEITTANTDSSSTVIGAHDWLVVYMNKEVFDNDGDTVKLFNQNDKLVDSYTYTDNDYCEIEPTPGEGNTSDTDGSCGGVPPNKSYARIPDGIGYWVDPIPTPGSMNRVEEDILEIIPEEELIDEETIVTEELVSADEIISEDTETTEDLTEETVEEITDEVIAEETESEEVVAEGDFVAEEEEEITEEDSEEGFLDQLIDEVVDQILEESTSEGTSSDSEETVEETTQEDDLIIEEASDSEEQSEEQLSENPPATENEEFSAPDNDSSEGSSSDSVVVEDSGSSDSDAGGGGDGGGDSVDSGDSGDGGDSGGSGSGDAGGEGASE